MWLVKERADHINKKEDRIAWWPKETINIKQEGLGMNEKLSLGKNCISFHALGIDTIL